MQNQTGLINEADEIIQIVDENNKPLGPATRQEMRDKKLIHRATYIFLENADTKKFYVHKRTIHKKWCPGFWDPTFGGVVQYEESYEQNAQRELLEEAGVEEKLVPLFEFFYDCRPDVSVWGKAFYTKTRKNLKLQELEVEQAVEMGCEELQQKIKEGMNMTFDGKMCFEIFMQKYNQYKELIDKELPY
ncbi:hypothetical protein ABPG72_014194 [Tetrahymena utriculariae]